MKNENVFCYVTDIGYLLPSIISAMGVRKHVKSEKADVIIFTVAVGEEKTQEADRILQPYNIRIQTLDESRLGANSTDRRVLKSTTKSMLGRLLLDEYLPD